jgi:ABC-type phosphate transport system substrate-binding protein
MRPVTITMWLAAGVALGLLAALPAAAHGQEGFVLIANRANQVSVLSRDEASKLFLLKRSKWTTGQNARPVDQDEASPVRRLFSNAVHRMDVPSVKSFWQELVFSGKGDPPPERPSDADVVAFVRSTPGALGYVSAVTPADGVKTIGLTP